jgi:hypothetical protein
MLALVQNNQDFQLSHTSNCAMDSCTVDMFAKDEKHHIDLEKVDMGAFDFYLRKYESFISSDFEYLLDTSEGYRKLISNSKQFIWYLKNKLGIWSHLAVLYSFLKPAFILNKSGFFLAYFEFSILFFLITH